jgi:hypothetical protein
VYDTLILKLCMVPCFVVICCVIVRINLRCCIALKLCVLAFLRIAVVQSSVLHCANCIPDQALIQALFVSHIAALVLHSSWCCVSDSEPCTSLCATNARTAGSRQASIHVQCAGGEGSGMHACRHTALIHYDTIALRRTICCTHVQLDTY